MYVFIKAQKLLILILCIQISLRFAHRRIMPKLNALTTENATKKQSQPSYGRLERAFYIAIHF